MIVEKLTEEELALYEVLRNPVFCGEFLASLEMDEEVIGAKKFEYTDYQREFLLDYSPQVNIHAGRAIGKCHHKDSRILNTETGEYSTVEELSKGHPILIPSLNEESMKLSLSRALIEYNGKFPCLEVTLTKGFRNVTTFEHPFYTNYGWVEAQDLKVGDFVAIPNELPFFGSGSVDDLDMAMIAHFIAEGSYHQGSITTTEPEVIKEITEFANRHKFKIKVYGKITYHMSYGNFRGGAPKNYWLRLLERCGLRNCHSYDKFIPKEFFSFNKKTLAILLNRLFSDDGWATEEEVGYATTSERLARDIHHLLLRFGVVASLGYKKNKCLGCWWLSIKGYANLVKFRDGIGFFVRRKQMNLDRAIIRSENTYNQSDLIPIPTFRNYKMSVKGRMLDRGVFASWAKSLRYFPTRNKKLLNRDSEFTKWETADIYWLRVKSIKEVGEQDTYSVEAYPDHTLIADDIYSHNTRALVEKLSWHAVNGFFDAFLFTVPNRSHLDPVFLGLQKKFRVNPLLQFWVGRYSVNSQQFLMKFLNNVTLTCRIAGTSGTGVNVVGLHVPVIVLDECLPSTAMINSQRGFRMIRTLRKGDKVLSWNGHEVVEDVVTHCWKKDKNQRELDIRSGDIRIRVGENHKLFDGTTYKAASEFSVGDLIYTFNRLRNELIPIKIDFHKEFKRVGCYLYDLEVENNHNFFVNGILTKNSAYYPWPTWVELQQVMNDWEPGHQIIVSGVPDGRREKSVLYQCSTSESFSKHQVSAYQNPRFTKEAEDRAIEQFGGKDSQDFIRQILGGHGTPTFALFDRENMRVEDYYYPTTKIWGMNLRKDAHVLNQLILNLPSPPRSAKSLILGVDLGYTEPSMLIGLYQKEDLWYILFRVELARIEYNIQEKFIDELHHKYNFDYIGLDVGAGGQGKAVYNSFINRDEFKSRNYSKIILPVEFGGTTVVGLDEEGKELKERIKPFSVTKLQELVNSYQLVFSKRDEDLLVELERIVYTRSPVSGQMVYKSITLGGSDRGADHSFAALLTFVMVLYERIEKSTDRGREPLYRPRWLL